MEHLLSSRPGKQPFQDGPAGKGPPKENSSPLFGAWRTPHNEILLNPLFRPWKADILLCEIPFSIATSHYHC
jgi:hypothetical protein